MELSRGVLVDRRRRAARGGAVRGVRCGDARRRADPGRVGRDVAASDRPPGGRPRPACGGLDGRRRSGVVSAGRGGGERRRDAARGRARRAGRALLDGLRLRRPQARTVRRVRRAEPPVGLRPHEAAGRGRGRRRRLGRAHVLAPRLDGHELRPDDAPARRGARRGGGRGRPARLADLRRPPRRRRAGAGGSPARAVARLGGGDCTWAELAEAIFEDAGVECRVRRITTAELDRPAPRPAYSVLRSERPDAPTLPHWRDGLRACLERLSS